MSWLPSLSWIMNGGIFWLEEPLIIGFTFNEVNSVRASASKVVCCHFSSDGKLLASGGHDKKVSVEVSMISFQSVFL